ncbi:MAG: hypothetical protein P8Y51_06120 [Campylobacterales bacterium]
MLQDLCVEKVEGEGFQIPGVTDSLSVQLGWTDTITLRNRGTETLTDVELTYDTTGFDVNLANKCGIDGDDETGQACREEAALKIGHLVNVVQHALFYEMPDFDADQIHTFYIENGVRVSFFSQERLYGSYLKDGVLFYGRIEQCGTGGGEINTAAADKADIISTFTSEYNYNDGHDKYLTTKVSGQSAPITGVHLNPTTHEAEAYQPVSGNPDWKFTIIPLLGDGTCSSAQNVIDPDTDKQLLIDIPWGSSDASTAQTAEMEIGNIERLGQCANSENQYREAYGDDAWERCGENHGRPCLSQNNGIADTEDETYNAVTDAIYTNDLGCYMCTFNIAPGCSTDNFAIRPESYDLDLNDTSALLTAGKPYTLNATGTSVGGGSTSLPSTSPTVSGPAPSSIAMSAISISRFRTETGPQWIRTKRCRSACPAQTGPRPTPLDVWCRQAYPNALSRSASSSKPLWRISATLLPTCTI